MILKDWEDETVIISRIIIHYIDTNFKDLSWGEIGSSSIIWVQSFKYYQRACAHRREFRLLAMEVQQPLFL